MDKKKKLKKDLKNYKHANLDIKNYKALSKIFKKNKKNIKVIIHAAAIHYTIGQKINPLWILKSTRLVR